MSGTRQLSGMRILLVEDNYLLAADAREWLESAGAEVIGPTPDAAEACRLIDSEAIDRAVVDINLGEGPGWEIASRLTERKVPYRLRLIVDFHASKTSSTPLSER